MTFIVTYRDKSGAKREEVIDAASREMAFSALKVNGITPLSLSKGVPRSPGVLRTKLFTIPLCLFVVIAAIAVIIWFFRSANEGMPNYNDNRYVSKVVKDVKPTAPTRSTTLVAPISTSKVSESTKKNFHNEHVASELHQAIKGVCTNSAIVYHAYDTNDPDHVHITQVNQELGALFSSQPGEQVIPFPFAFQADGDDRNANYDNMNDGFLASLKNPIEMRDGDSLDKLEWKRNILEARLALLDGIRNGVSVKDAIKEEYAFRVRAYEARSAYIRDLRDYAAESPDVEAFRDTLKAVNDKLSTQGIKSISMDDVGVEDSSVIVDATNNDNKEKKE
ncbi:MAG: hypothetical protein IKO72_01665 [Kiritimatiellae bacterium]|nr:hypothetical protein [Kiritimatiellia bacterium]